MSKRTKAAAGTSATPAKTSPRRASNAEAAARTVKLVAEKKPSKLIARTPGRRKPEVTPEQRRCYVEVAAYFIAERHGFTPGREHEDWVTAEAEIDRMLSEGLLAP